MNYLSKFYFFLRGFLFPCGCALCSCSLLGVEEMRYGLCTKCRDSIKPVEGQKCQICGKPLVSERDVCIFCRNGGQHSYDRLWVLFPYTGKYRKLLASYKFGKNLSIANFFAEHALELIKREEVLIDAVVVPVPPRPGKIKASGWDQIECLVKRFNKNVNIHRCLKRRKSGVQKRLGRQDRMENLKGRIIVNEEAPKIALVIDDVITTGSTMEVCAASLKKGGAEKVYGLCLFYD